MSPVANVMLAIVLIVMAHRGSNPVQCERSAHVHDGGIFEGGIHDPKVSGKEHIAEHLKEEEMQFNVTDITDDELEFHFFRLHDLNNDSKLDGLELFKAFLHTLSPDVLRVNAEKYLDHLRPSHGYTSKELEEEEMKDMEVLFITGMTDKVLETEDENNDGYISYQEFVKRRRSAETPDGL